MKFFLFLPFLVWNTSLAVALPASDGYVPSGAQCQDYAIPVTVTSSNYPWTAAKWTDNYGLIDYVSTATSRTDAGFPPPFGNPVNQTATYTIGATFCTPTNPATNSDKVLLATHGLAFDRSYWNPDYKPDQYNFVQYAVQRGYSVFFYDRLGVGTSTRVSGFDAQLNSQTSILASLIDMIRMDPTKWTLLAQAPESIILVGHSFGSVVTNSLVAAYPTLADAAIMTGYGSKGSDVRLDLQGFAPRVASLQSSQFSAFDPGYITTGDVFSNINNFFKAPAYEHDVAQYSEDHKSPFSILELVSSTTPSLLNVNASDFKRPAMVITGEYDYLVCGGYCPGELEPSVAPLFMGAKGFEIHIQPGAGHGTNFATNATGFYGVIFDYLGRSGL